MLLIDKLARSRSLTGTRCLLSGALLIKPGSIFGLPPQAVSQSRSLAVSQSRPYLPTQLLQLGILKNIY